MKREIIKTNDTIRARDFKPCLGRGDCYVEGVVDVVKLSNDYLIECTDETVCPRVGERIKVPVMTSNDYPSRVINLTRI